VAGENISRSGKHVYCASSEYWHASCLHQW